MLELTKIQTIAESYSPQELFAALVWQRQFNNFDGEQVITDLLQHNITDGTDTQYTYRLKRMLRYRFEEALWGNENKEQRDAVVVSYWWD
ncbi:hypothetical protein NIES267_38440 [Calothrix parasitica NIES-267]|uniref:Uncharacterized protein n=1 Tax=Calothrix parasitica NIES-267 TaxID=1973488 RepID=A0A1Z4LTF9_9CYAN|nr:hypothetical protein NIES267_38440 [Calothrix parasitica NIES-267]